VEGTGFENRRTRKGTVGSNPSSSADIIRESDEAPAPSQAARPLRDLRLGSVSIRGLRARLDLVAHGVRTRGLYVLGLAGDSTALHAARHGRARLRASPRFLRQHRPATRPTNLWSE